jgi:hypothetical protein
VPAHPGATGVEQDRSMRAVGDGPGKAARYQWGAVMTRCRLVAGRFRLPALHGSEVWTEFELSF